MTASKRVKFRDLEQLARERAYTVRRVGREIFWRRNGQDGAHNSTGVASAWEDILLDCSSEKPEDEGTVDNHGEPT